MGERSCGQMMPPPYRQTQTGRSLLFAIVKVMCFALLPITANLAYVHNEAKPNNNQDPTEATVVRRHRVETQSFLRR